MYLIIDILGKQYKIFKDLKFKIDKINLNINSILILNKILFFKSNSFFVIDKFILNKIIIYARILNHSKSKKINILKFKRRKGYKKTIGFKKFQTELFIEKINLKIFFNYFKNGTKKIRRFF